MKQPKEVAPRIPLREADPRGRLDVAVYNMGRAVAEHCGGEKAWKGGLGEVVEVLIENAGIPSTVFTPRDLMQAIGIGGRKR